jgi:hypothetical protein
LSGVGEIELEKSIEHRRDKGPVARAICSPVIPGRYGQIEWFDGRDLAVHTNRRRLFEKVWAIPGMKRHQTGDLEMRAVFPLEGLEHVARVIKARRRRTLAPEAARRRGFKPTLRVTSAG